VPFFIFNYMDSSFSVKRVASIGVNISVLFLFEKRLAEAREDAISVMKLYQAEIDAQRARMNASRNGFIRTCCQQTIDQLTAEKRAIEAEVVG